MMADPVYLSAALRGVPLTCRRRLHRFRLIEQHRNGTIYTSTLRCSRCGTVRREEGPVR